ncbi:hypothetical protein JW906_15995 [bacterium]|nr:hypothetical protein [bacterium]
MKSWDAFLSDEEREAVAELSSPFKIQSLLDTFIYSPDSFYRCPLRVLRERTAHCFDGALFAAAMLRRIGFPPLILEMLPNERDDDHLLAVFKLERHWGAVAKSNFTGLRYREPIFRTLRELVISYFESYFNLAGEKTLTGYTAPLNLRIFDSSFWMLRDEPLERIADHLDTLRRYRILTQPMEKRLSPVDPRTMKAGLLDSNEAGLYCPADPASGA